VHLPKSMIFKGVSGLRHLMQDLFLDVQGCDLESILESISDTVPLVHMGVVSSCMGVRLQTSQCCYLENPVLEGCEALRGGWIGLEGRSPDQCNIVRLSVRDWSGFYLPPGLVPVSNDLVITSKGSMVHRLAWAGVPWDARAKQELLSACARVVEAIASVL
jgi:hypothetical protein